MSRQLCRILTERIVEVLHQRVKNNKVARQSLSTKIPKNALQFAPYFVIVNGAHKSNYTGDIYAVLQSLDDNLQSNVRKIIVVSVGLFVAMVFISCVLTYFSVSVPLAKITSIMIDLFFSQNATSFDFAAYKNMEKQFCSHITELATMEKVFYRALKSAPGNESHIGSTAAPNRSQRKPL
ncbi:hypothetical protein BJ741DRAFT_596957 [Chytriomyces cf. hyalinus JEL632]|nr:hypothetical protein BJ741DRAFT_596957 [Chytriomyces cf. hyalinus JEL632]